MLDKVVEDIKTVLSHKIKPDFFGSITFEVNITEGKVRCVNITNKRSVKYK